MKPKKEKTLCKSGYYTPFKAGPATHKRIPTGPVLVSIQFWCLMYLICRQYVSTFTTGYTLDQLNLSKGTERFPHALSYSRKKWPKKTFVASGQMQEAMSLINVHSVQIIDLLRTIK